LKWCESNTYLVVIESGSGYYVVDKAANEKKNHEHRGHGVQKSVLVSERQSQQYQKQEKGQTVGGSGELQSIADVVNNLLSRYRFDSTNVHVGQIHQENRTDHARWESDPHVELQNNHKYLRHAELRNVLTKVGDRKR
jgi:hypothetical protein